MSDFEQKLLQGFVDRPPITPEEAAELVRIAEFAENYQQVSKTLCGKGNATLEEVLHAVEQAKNPFVDGVDGGKMRLDVYLRSIKSKLKYAEEERDVRSKLAIEQCTRIAELEQLIEEVAEGTVFMSAGEQHVHVNSDVIADHLLANGVTVQNWRDAKTEEDYLSSDRMFDLNQFAAEVHQNAVANGFWEDATDDRTLAHIHSEWSEALQADRSGCTPREVCMELIDGVLRLLDFAAANHLLVQDFGYNWQPNFIWLICRLHHDVSVIRQTSTGRDDYISVMISTVFAFCRGYEIDPYELMQAKHAYNLTRPHKHGKRY